MTTTTYSYVSPATRYDQSGDAISQASWDAHLMLHKLADYAGMGERNSDALRRIADKLADASLAFDQAKLEFETDEREKAKKRASEAGSRPAVTPGMVTERATTPSATVSSIVKATLL